MKNFVVAVFIFLLGVALAAAHQSSNNDEAGRILALEKVWNRALEEKDTKALDMLLSNTLVSIDIDGSIQTKSEFWQASSLPITSRLRQSPNKATSRFMEMRLSSQVSFA